MSRTTTRSPLLAAALLLLATSASAYQLEDAGANKVRWQRNSAHFELVNSSFAPGDRTGVSRAMALWNQSNADFTLLPTGGDDAVGWLNGQNEVARTAEGWGGDGNTLGITWYWFNPFTGWIVEADILINDTANTPVEYITSTADHDTYDSVDGSKSLVEVMLHEFGHAIGLQHEEDVYNNMGRVPFVHVNGTVLHNYVGADSVLGAATLYGHASYEQDISVVHLRRTGASDGYSDHGKGRILSAVSGEPFLANSIPRGANRFRAEFTYENIGPKPVIMDIDFVLSADDVIDAGDSWLGSAQRQLGPYQVWTAAHLVDLPPGTAQGWHWVGAIVSSANETGPTENNAAGHKIWVSRNGDNFYCTADYPCAVGEGNCWSDADCMSGLQCAPDVGPSWGLGAGTDVCEPGPGSSSFCSSARPCGHGQGDCDGSSECVNGTTCVNNVGADYGWASWVDVCELPRGHTDFCSIDTPCEHGEGDCDSHAECAAGTKCYGGYGTYFGYESWVDVCL